MSEAVAITEAAQWMAETPYSERSGKPVVVELRDRFGLTPIQSIEAIREANELRARAK